MFIGHRNVPILKQNSNGRLGASKDAKWIATLSRAREKPLNTGFNNSRYDKRYLLEVFMVLQNHWVVSCNYNGEIYGVELFSGLDSTRVWRSVVRQVFRTWCPDGRSWRMGRWRCRRAG